MDLRQKEEAGRLARITITILVCPLSAFERKARCGHRCAPPALQEHQYLEIQSHLATTELCPTSTTLHDSPYRKKPLFYRLRPSAYTQSRVLSRCRYGLLATTERHEYQALDRDEHNGQDQEGVLQGQRGDREHLHGGVHRPAASVQPHWIPLGHT